MALSVRIIGFSLLTSALGAGLGLVFFGKHPDHSIPVLLLACAGGIIGAVAGAAGGIVTALRERPST